MGWYWEKQTACLDLLFLFTRMNQEFSSFFYAWCSRNSIQHHRPQPTLTPSMYKRALKMVQGQRFRNKPSLPPTYMAFIETQSNKSEAFHKFFESWLTEQNQHLQELISASKTSSEANLRLLVDRVVRHYELYYHVKSACTAGNVLSILTPYWRSRLEDAFLWIGGWRPTMAFHLLYSKSGLQVELIELPDLARGLSTRDLADLSHDQLCRVDELQRQTIKDERELTESMARIQEKAADSKMVKLSYLATEEGGGDEDLVNRVESALGHKEKEMEEIVHKADEIRLRTLKGVLDILTPTQSTHFLIAAAELHQRLHEWGRKKDDEEQPQQV